MRLARAAHSQVALASVGVDFKQLDKLYEMAGRTPLHEEVPSRLV